MGYNLKRKKEHRGILFRRSCVFCVVGCVFSVFFFFSSEQQRQRKALEGHGRGGCQELHEHGAAVTLDDGGDESALVGLPESLFFVDLTLSLVPFDLTLARWN